MRRSPLVHVTLGALVVLFSGIAGQISHVEQRDHPRRCPRPHDASYPCSSGYRPTWSMAPATPPSRLLVKFRGGKIPAFFLDDIAPDGGQGTIGRFKNNILPGIGEELFPEIPGLILLDFDDATSEQRALAFYNRDSNVEYAEMDELWHVDAMSGAPSDARYAEQWGLENTGQSVGGHPAGTAGVDIGARDVWAIQTGSEDVVVGVIDSGVDYTHEDLAANMWTNPGEIPGNGIDDDGNGVVDDVHGFNAVDKSGDPADDLGHGTHVAGIIGAVGDNGTGVAGVNWTTRIMALKFLGPTGGGTTTDAIECIDYAIDMQERGVNIRVINCSWGGTDRSEALEDAIGRAGDHGILFVCASGNDSVDTDRVPHFPSAYETDAVVSVAALAPNDTLAGFSNWGEKSVDIAAPGVDILSTLPHGQYGFASGTSMASPFVAGVAALVAAGDPKMPIKTLRKRVLDGSFGVSDFSRKLATGGRLNGPGAFH